MGGMADAGRERSAARANLKEYVARVSDDFGGNPRPEDGNPFAREIASRSRNQVQTISRSQQTDIEKRETGRYYGTVRRSYFKIFLVTT